MADHPATGSRRETPLSRRRRFALVFSLVASVAMSGCIAYIVFHEPDVELDVKLPAISADPPPDTGSVEWRPVVTNNTVETIHDAKLVITLHGDDDGAPTIVDPNYDTSDLDTDEFDPVEVVDLCPDTTEREAVCVSDLKPGRTVFELRLSTEHVADTMKPGMRFWFDGRVSQQGRTLMENSDTLTVT